MKKLIFLTLIAAFVFGLQNQSVAWVTEKPVSEVSKAPNYNNYVWFRLDPTNQQAYLVFYGPAHKLGDDLEIKIHDAGSGAIVQQEFMTAHGGGTVQVIHFEGLEPGAYSVVVTGNVYNLSQPFILE